jgi:hypothetical protein
LLHSSQLFLPNTFVIAIKIHKNTTANNSFEQHFLSEISSSHGGEYDVEYDDGGSTHLWNVGRQSFYTAVHPRRQFWTTLSKLWFILSRLELGRYCNWWTGRALASRLLTNESNKYMH